jgi:hypothetical protein
MNKHILFEAHSFPKHILFEQAAGITADHAQMRDKRLCRNTTNHKHMTVCQCHCCVQSFTTEASSPQTGCRIDETCFGAAVSNLLADSSHWHVNQCAIAVPSRC